MKKNSKFIHNAKISVIIKDIKHVVNIYDSSNRKVGHLKSWKFLIRHLQD